jgi:hypothetical protein
VVLQPRASPPDSLGSPTYQLMEFVELQRLL